ncbi:PTS fructose transporter subunit IIABC [Enterococcus alishanensis]|nr:fructose-specific PTS transporter subunit EIIC [Enterococcus alishanensis]
MELHEMTSQKLILVNQKLISKEAILKEMIELFFAQGIVADKKAFLDSVLQREEESATGMENGLAIPHGKSSAVLKPAFAVMTLENPLTNSAWESVNQENQVETIFLLAVPADKAGSTHLKLLSELSVQLMDPNFIQSIHRATTAQGVYTILQDRDQKKSEEDAEPVVATDKFIVGVTACTTGIAHTYMAAEALEEAGKKLGVKVHIEKQGASGIEDRLTKEMIAQADGVIFAVDTNVKEKERFADKPFVEVKVAVPLKKAESLLTEVLENPQGKVKIANKVTDSSNESQEEKKGIYTHFMTGVNFMLPFVIAGGIITALSFAFGIEASDPTSASYNVLAAALNEIGGGTALALMVPILAGGVAYSIAGRPGIAPGVIGGMLASTSGAGFLGGLVGGMFAGYLTAFIVKHLKVPKSIQALSNLIIVPLLSVLITGLVMKFLIGQPIAALMNFLNDWLNSLGTTNGVLFGILIGCFMAFDMGGPLNKAMATFAMGMMANGVYEPIAACMVAGMTPPLGIALATVLFKKKFSQKEREAGMSCWIMGASYITEGAIPFAVANPFRIIPSLMAGSAVAAAISITAGCASRAPHGGIWVMFIPGVMNNLLMYIVAIVAGTVVTGLLVGLVTKNPNKV